MRRLLLTERQLALPPDKLPRGTDEIHKASAFLSAMRRACTNRVSFVAGNSSIGLGPKILQKDDIIVILYGDDRS